MKPSIPAIALAALLATASAKEGYLVYVETEAGAPAFIPDTATYEEYTGSFKNKVDSKTDICCSFAGLADFYNYALMRQGLFSKDDSSLKLEETGLRAYNGSIVLDNLTIINSDMTTESDGKTDAFWGLPQIALSNVKFLPGNPSSDPSSFISNYSTFTDWEATDCTIELKEGGATFTSGSVHGAVVIDALAEDAKIHLTAKPDKSGLGDGTLTINAKDKIAIGETPGVGEDILVVQGNLTLNYTGKGSAEGWDVDVLSQVNGSLTVNAATGRVNAGILSGSGKITAKQAYLTSFTGSNLEIHATDAVAVNGNVEATAAAASGDYAVVLEGAGISIGGSVSATSGGVSLKSTGTDISIEGAWSTAKPSSLVSARDIIIRGEVSGSMAATAANSIFLYADAALAQSSLGARVYHGGKLVLKERSSVTGDVISSVSGAGVVVENSSISGLVDGAGTLDLCNGVIGSAQNISTLKSQGESSITAQAGPLTLDALVLGGGSLTLGTPESHSAAVVLNKLTVDASTVLNANLVAKPGATLEFSENSVVTLGCTVTLMGDAAFILPGEGLLMDSVEDVLDANGQSITLSWDHSADLPVWHKELYEAADARGNTFYTTNAAAPGATLSMLQLVYDRTMQDNGCLRITAIPEPATATLSLLALAALCARRCRKVF